MNCPVCQSSENRVMHTDAGETEIRRRRECCRCRHRWNSTEITEDRARLLEALLTRLQPVRELLP